MIRGVWIAAAGMRAQFARLTRVASDLANLRTVGYRQERAALGAFPALALHRLDEAGRDLGAVGPLPTGAGLADVALDRAQGPLQETSRALDLALVGPGFFVVQTPDGPRYTRAGAFVRAEDGQLATPDGLPVLGEQGPLVLPPGPVAVAPDGAVLVDGVLVDRLLLVDVPAGVPIRVDAGGRLEAAGAGPARGAAVRQGSLELANVDPARAAVELLAAARAYGASQRALAAQNQTLERFIQEVGRG